MFKLVLISNSLKYVLKVKNNLTKVKNNLTKKELAYFLAHITGLGREVEVAKIQAGVGQVTTTTNYLDTPLTTEQFERYRKAEEISRGNKPNLNRIFISQSIKINFQNCP